MEGDAAQGGGLRSHTALLLVGFQNDFFADDGLLRGVLEDHAGLARARATTLRLLEVLAPTDTLIVAAPIGFSEDYHELVDPVGVLATIKAAGAFRRDASGAALIDAFAPFRERIVLAEGRSGFDAFTNTGVGDLLSAAGVQDVLMAGALDSVCIDSTARAAFERGHRVTVVRDCTVGRTAFEHDFFCNDIFPMYARVIESHVVLDTLGSAAA